MKLPLAALLAGSAALLAACGGAGGLIPVGNAGPLREDFEKVAKAAAEGNGDCSGTKAAIAQTESDFNRLPSSVSSALRTKLSEGIAHLSSQAQIECAQPSSEGATTTASSTSSTATKSTYTPTSTTTSTSTSTEAPGSTSSTSVTSTTSPPPVGGAEAPSGGGAESNPGGSPAEGEGAK